MKVPESPGAFHPVAVGLLSIGAYEEAARFADAWILAASPKDFDARWHRLMCDWHNDNLLESTQKHHEIQEHFPDNERLKGLYEAAKGRVEEMIAPTNETKQEPTSDAEKQ